RRQVERLLKALLPSLQAGELDAGVAVRGPKGGQFPVVGGVKLKEGAALGQTLRDLAKEALQGAPEAVRSKVHLDVAKVGGATVHRLDVQDQFDAKARKVFGDNPLFVA